MTHPAFFLVGFLILKSLVFSAERFLSWLNFRQRHLQAEQDHALSLLKINTEDLQNSIAYADEKYRFGWAQATFDFALLFIFIASGLLGHLAKIFETTLTPYSTNPTVIGLCFLGFIFGGSYLVSLPFQYYYTFVIETKYGFNRQTNRSFWLDQLKACTLSVIFGAPFIFCLLWVMKNMGQHWWLWAWGVVTFFSIFSIWIYPTVIAPRFNRFSPLPDGDLKDQILDLSKKIGFKTSGLSVMDASKRSAHANAYFTGVFGEKKIVLFDTLLNLLTPAEITAVLAHELGHFKLKHIRYGLLRSIAFSGFLFFIFSLLLPIPHFYTAFGFASQAPYAALVIFSLWFGPIEFLLKPILSHWSRRNEFAADNFAKETLGSGVTLSSALLKLREKSQSVPITHPLFSLFYHSHPPIIERLKNLSK